MFGTDSKKTTPSRLCKSACCTEKSKSRFLNPKYKFYHKFFGFNPLETKFVTNVQIKFNSRVLKLRKKVL